jgi:hypothetical protein
MTREEITHARELLDKMDVEECPHGFGEDADLCDACLFEFQKAANQLLPIVSSLLDMADEQFDIQLQSQYGMNRND